MLQLPSFSAKPFNCSSTYLSYYATEIILQKIIIKLKMYFEDQEQLPSLIPIKKKKEILKPEEDDKDKAAAQKNQMFNMFTNQIGKELAKSMTEEKKQQQQQQQQKDVSREPLNQDSIEEIEKKFKGVHSKSNRIQKKKNFEREKQNQKSKFLIEQMMRKINAKNITEQLYPASNQTIEKLIKKMQNQIQSLKYEAEKKQKSLFNNPNNQHLKKQLQGLEQSINRCVTIQQLYNEKVNLRNKISILERNTIKLKQENGDLKIKISRNVEDIENHMHNLPCEREKQLKQLLSKCMGELKKEKQMRQSLENNVSEIIFNFKRLYEEADAARLIITKKLKQIEDRQRNIKEPEIHQAVKQTPSQKRNISDIEQRKPKKTFLPNSESSHKDESKTSKKLPGSIMPIPQTSKKMAINSSDFSLEDKLRKMRGNQTTAATRKYSHRL